MDSSTYLSQLSEWPDVINDIKDNSSNNQQEFVKSNVII